MKCGLAFALQQTNLIKGTEFPLCLEEFFFLRCNFLQNEKRQQCDDYFSVHNFLTEYLKYDAPNANASIIYLANEYFAGYCNHIDTIHFLSPGMQSRYQQLHRMFLYLEYV